MNPNAAEKLDIKPFDAADCLRSDEDCARCTCRHAWKMYQVTPHCSPRRSLMWRARHDAAGARHGYAPGRAVALGENGKPSFATVMQVLDARGWKLHVESQAVNA